MPVQYYFSHINTQDGFDTNSKDNDYFHSDNQLYFKNQTHFQSTKKTLSEVATK